MHGRVKQTVREHEANQTDADRQELRNKVQTYQEVSAKMLKFRVQQASNATAADPSVLLPLTRHLVLLNPEFHIVWSFRRELLEPQLPTIHDIAVQGTLSEPVQEIATRELQLTFDALQRHPKSYATWYQRQWLVDRKLSDPVKELALCDRLLDLDERNFHCWNYRRHLCRLAKVETSEQLAFTTHKIEQNFSNYSALHNRTLVLPRPLTPEILDQEIEMVQQAVFTEPDDQSPWFYYRWLVTSMLQVIEAQGDGSEGQVAFISSQLEWLQELRDMEQDAKWVLTTLADLYRRLAGLKEVESSLQTSARQQGFGICSQLIEVDADHAGFYQAMLRHFEMPKPAQQ